MDWNYTEEQQEISQLARKILEDLATTERIVAIEAGDDGIDRELYTALGQANLLGVAIDEEHGGLDLGFVGLGLLLQEIGRTVAPVPVLASLALGALPVSKFGSSRQKSDLLPGVASGDLILTAALIEVGSEDPTRPQTSARADAAGGGWRIDGVKTCVPVAHLAHRVLVPARINDEQMGVFLVDPKAAGVKLDAQRTTSREHQFQITLTDVAVAGDDLLGSPEDGAAIAHWMHERATIAYCMVQLGVSERALEMTAEYTRTRMQFDRPIGSFQAVHMRAGDAFIDIEAMRLTALQALWRLGEERTDDGSVAIAKFWAAEGGQRAGYAAQHLHGGIGIDIDYPLHRYYLWAKQCELSLGSAPVQLTKIGAAIAESTPA